MNSTWYSLIVHMRKLMMACINEDTMLKLICARDLPLEMFKEKENSNEIFSAGNNQFDYYKMLKLAEYECLRRIS